MHAEASNKDPRHIIVTFPGSQCHAWLESICADSAVVRLGNIRPLWVGRLAAISVKDLPAFTGYIRHVDGDLFHIAFQKPLHHTVVAAASPTRRKYSAGAAA